MIKAAGRGPGGRPLLLLGLSGENMTRLMADEPVMVDAAELGVGDVMVLLVGGRTEDDIVRKLTEAGMVSGSTETDDQRPSTP